MLAGFEGVRVAFQSVGFRIRGLVRVFYASLTVEGLGSRDMWSLLVQD